MNPQEFIQWAEKNPIPILGGMGVLVAAVVLVSGSKPKQDPPQYVTPTGQTHTTPGNSGEVLVTVSVLDDLYRRIQEEIDALRQNGYQGYNYPPAPTPVPAFVPPTPIPHPLPPVGSGGNSGGGGGGNSGGNGGNGGGGGGNNSGSDAYHLMRVLGRIVNGVH